MFAVAPLRLDVAGNLLYTFCLPLYDNFSRLFNLYLFVSALLERVPSLGRLVCSQLAYYDKRSKGWGASDVAQRYIVPASRFRALLFGT